MLDGQLQGERPGPDAHASKHNEFDASDANAGRRRNDQRAKDSTATRSPSSVGGFKSSKFSLRELN